ncbi:Rhodanase, C-terminal [Dillenia turbinata]|uniref:Rhodanase, C-terminal n=1 Tax=Dillenia turbinata TaxID=194707 RepID=A0AAN8UQN1_9MAGN
MPHWIQYILSSAISLHATSCSQFVENKHSDNHKKHGLLDARNLYETRIGKFQSPNVEIMDPKIRQYSDLPLWIDDHSEQLRGNHILIFARTAILPLVLTLEAAKGLPRILILTSVWRVDERYCTGGIRCEMASAYIWSKGPGFENVFQLYDGIQHYMEQFPGGGIFKGKNFVFDHSVARIAVASSDSNIIGVCLLCESSFDDYSSRCRCTCCRMLVLVCDKCQELAQYVFVLCQKQHKEAEAVHIKETSKGYEILASNTETESHQPEDTSSSNHVPQLPQFLSRRGHLRKLRILCLHGFRQNASGFKGRTASLAKKLKSIAELVFVNAPHELPFIYQPCLSEQQPIASSISNQSHQPPEKCNKKFAWLVPPDFNQKAEDGWRIAVGHLILFGAAMAASVCALRRRQEGQIDFRFAILCSGFALKSMKVEPGWISCPSLHIFGRVEGKDRQITTQASRDLAALFEEGCSVVFRGRAYSTHKIFDAGQPTAATHPKLFQEGELTPGITVEEYISRRKRLLELLPDKSLAIIAAAPIKMMTDVVPYTFRQDADYSYITGCQQPGGIAVIGHECGLCMFMPEADPHDVVWQGQIAGVDAALNTFKADGAHPISKLHQVLPDLIAGSTKLYHNVKTASPKYMELEAFQKAAYNGKVKDLSMYTHELKWIKSPAELNLMRKSASIACQALLQTMLHSKLYPYENVLAAKVEYECRIRGAQRMAFNPVVGGGPNASVIHYSRNDQMIKSGDFVLMDVGCELHGYLSDLTRTWPPCGSFSSVQEMYFYALAVLGAYCYIVFKLADYVIRTYAKSMHISIFAYCRDKEDGKRLVITSLLFCFLWSKYLSSMFDQITSVMLLKEELYNLILETNKECVEFCKPGMSLRQIHNYSVEMLHKGLKQIGLLKDDRTSFRSFHQLNPTAIGHYLGMDVHDCSAISNDRPLEPGVVITIEPGIYIPPSFDCPERYQGIGIRIEDEVLITETGHEVLTGSMPKEVKHIESLLNNFCNGGREAHNVMSAASS